MNSLHKKSVDKRLQFWIEELENEGYKVKEEEKESYAQEITKMDQDRKITREKLRITMADFFYKIFQLRKVNKY